MTDELADVDRAIQAYISRHFEGALVDSWIVVTHSQQIESHDLSNYRIITPDSQPFHIDDGLISTGQRIVDDSWDRALADEDYEE